MTRWGVGLCLLLCSASFAYAQSDLNFGKAFQLDQLVGAAQQSASVAGGRAQSFSVRYMQVGFLKKKVSSLFAEAACVGVPQQKRLVCRGTSQQLKAIGRLVKQLDRPVEQIRIEVTILETSSQQSNTFKHLFSDVGDGLKVNIDANKQLIRAADSIDSLLVAIQQNGEAKILARPTLTVLDHELSVIKVGDRVPYITTVIRRDQEAHEVRHLDTGVELRLQPTLLSKNRVRVDINARVSEIKLWRDLGSTSYPVLSNRQAETMVEIPLGETLVIAGLLDEQKVKNTKKVPFLWKIPLLGRLFTSKYQSTMTSDVVFIIQPSRVDG